MTSGLLYCIFLHDGRVKDDSSNTIEGENMVMKIFGRGIAFALLMLSVVSIAMVEATENNTTVPNQTAVPEPSLVVSATPDAVTVATATNISITVTSAGAAVSGATVTLSGAATGTGTTDSSGRVVMSVNALGAGTITATASKSGFTSASRTITATAPLLSITASPNAITTGTSTNISFTVTSGGAAVGDAMVILSGAATDIETTGPNGSVVISINLTGAGTITAIASKSGFTNARTTITATEPALTMTANNPSAVTIGIPVNVTFTVSSAGAPVSGATVTLSGAATDSGTTDASGSIVVSVNATSAGTITATASKSGFTSASKTFTASAPGLSMTPNPSAVTIGIPVNVTFTVTSAGAPVSGAAVSISGAATGNGTTDASGSIVVSVNATSAGVITATASKDGFTSAIATVNAILPPLSVIANPNNITVATSTNVTFTVTSGGAPVSEATVTLTGAATGSGTTDINGSVVISVNATSAGTFTATASKSGFTSASRTLTVGNAPDTTPPASVTNVSVTGSGASWLLVSWTNPSDSDFHHVMVFKNNAFLDNTTINSYNITGLNSGTTYGITLKTVDSSGNVNQTGTNLTAATNTNAPIIIKDPPNQGANVETIGTDPAIFKMHSDQTANIVWNLDGSQGFDNGSVTAGVISTYTATSTVGLHKVTVNATNITTGLSSTAYWNWTVRSKTYLTGDRIWDERKASSTYTWNPYSFSGFYYNLDDDLGSENLTIKNIRRTLSNGDILYKTSPQEVGFKYLPFGRYEVIGFMADKYFAGYTPNSTISNNKTISALGSRQLHRVLFDDDDRRTVSEGGTLTLKDGYVLKIKAVDIGAGAGQIWISLLKDGNEVDSDVKAGGETYVYQPAKVGSARDLPIIAVHFENVFRGREVNAAFIKGVFQISDTYTSVKSGDIYGAMKISGIGGGGIEMRNENSIDLSAGSKVDLMGDLKIVVADNSSVLRFALSVERPGTFEVRGTVYPVTNEWTPMNFGMDVGGTSIGFYYDMDEDIGNENLKINANITGSIPDDALKYTTSPAEVSFKYSSFGKYNVIGFMAEKYFAGYTANSIVSNNKVKSTLGNKQLHRVLLDDDDRRTVSEGGTLTLKEGYVLKIKAVDIGAGAGQIWISLLKDGNEVDSDVKAGGETYVYQPAKVGSLRDFPLIAVHFENVFRGREVNAAFIKGVFQISDTYTSVKSGDSYGVMKISSVGDAGVEMTNDNSIDLSAGSDVDLMGNIKFKVADSSTLRFYPFVEVKPEMVANQLVIDAPAKANAGDAIKIKVTAASNPVETASITFDSSDIGQTDKDGFLNYTLPITMKGVHNITANKLGYQKGSKSIEVLEYIEHRLSIDAPAKANQLETITIRVTSNGTAIGGAAVKYDNTTIGSTDSNGALNYTLETSGTHSISASKSTFITAVRDIDVRVLFSEYKALDINISPSVVLINQETGIRSNITNAGTKKDTLPVELIINGNALDNMSVTLAPGETKEINFTRKFALEGNYTVEVLGQKELLEVKKEPLNLLLVGGIATAFGAIIIYLFTAKSKISIGALKNLLGKLGKKGSVGAVSPPQNKE